MRNRLPMQETRSLFNPGFIASNIHAFVEGYTTNNDVEVPLSLFFIGIPLCLHTNTRSILPTTASKKLHLWIQENQNILIGFGERAVAMRDRIKLGIIFAHSASLVEYTHHGTIRLLKKPKGYTSLLSDGDVHECITASRRMGKIFSKVEDPALIYYLLGVRP